jgi:hypothetical protein
VEESAMLEKSVQGQNEMTHFHRQVKRRWWDHKEKGPKQAEKNLGRVTGQAAFPGLFWP